MPQTTIEPTGQELSGNALLDSAYQFSKNQKALLQRAQEEVSLFISRVASVSGGAALEGKDLAALKKSTLALNEARLSASAAEIQRLSDLINEIHRRNRQLRSELDDRFGELVVLTSLLRDHEAIRGSRIDITEWACEVIVALRRAPWWWSILGANKRRQRELAKLQRLGLFDARAYMQLYPDVAASGMDPLFHFAQHGCREGRTLTS